MTILDYKKFQGVHIFEGMPLVNWQVDEKEEGYFCAVEHN